VPAFVWTFKIFRDAANWQNARESAARNEHRRFSFGVFARNNAS
jgi:hypothetical protein